MRLRVLVDHELDRELELGGPLGIGRAADNELRLDDEAVSSHHGRVERDDDGAWEYVDLGSANGSLVAAGPRLRRGERVRLTEQTQILVGRTVLEFVPDADAGPTPLRPRSSAERSDAWGDADAERHAPPGAPPGAPRDATSPRADEPPRARVVVLERGERRLVELRPPRVRIGRAADCELRVGCASVSQQHAELRADGRGWSVRDLGSTNGTRVGLVPVRGERRLASGSHLILGELDLFFVEDGAPAPLAEDRAFLRWLERQRELGHAQAEQALEARRVTGRSLDEVLVHSGLLGPGQLTELRRQAAGEGASAPDDGSGAERSSARLLMLVVALAVLGLLAWLAGGA